MNNLSLDSRVKNLESGFDDMQLRVDTHERALFGGLDPDTNTRHIGVFEQLGDAVSELKKITETMQKGNAYIQDVGKLAISWIGRLSVAFIMGIMGALWFVLTHWSAFSKAFETASSH